MLFAFLAAALAALVGNLQHIEMFKASPSGIEARTRAVVQQAENALDKLRELAAANGTLLVEMIVSGGRWGGASTPSAKDEQKEQVLEMLRGAGVPQARIDEVARSDRRWVIVDYVNGILSRPGSSLKPDQMNEWNTFVGKLNDTLDRPGPDVLRSFLDRLGFLDERERELIEDYRYYLMTGQHRRPDAWANRGSW
jgi:hypothetical protein